MKRRDALTGLLAAFLGLRFAKAAGKAVPIEWERVPKIPAMKTIHFEAVTVGQVDCGAGTCYRLHLYTKARHYSIVVKPKYLGCTMSNREPLPGETWTRGSDLADGKPSRQTWNRIQRDIVRLEQAKEKAKK